MTQEDSNVKKSKRRRPRRRRRSVRVKLPEIFFCGDPHGSFDHINAAAREHKPAAMIILGDLQPPAPLEVVLAEALKYTQVWWIPGNHDTDSDDIYDALWRGGLSGHNLHGRVANVAGLRIAGLGGVFRGQIWMPDGQPNYFCAATFMRRMGSGNLWRGGLPRRHRSSIFPSVYSNLLKQHADILVTHEAPGCHRKGFEALDRLATSLGVRWYFHGHQHEDRSYSPYRGMTVRAVGYRGIVNLKGEVIVPAQLDPREAEVLENAFVWANRDVVDEEPLVQPEGEAVVSVASMKVRLRVPESTQAEHEAALGEAIARLTQGGCRKSPGKESARIVDKRSSDRRGERKSAQQRIDAKVPNSTSADDRDGKNRRNDRSEKSKEKSKKAQPAALLQEHSNPPKCIEEGAPNTLKKDGKTRRRRRRKPVNRGDGKGFNRSGAKTE